MEAKNKKIKLVCDQCAVVTECEDSFKKEPRCKECGCTSFMRIYKKEELFEINQKRQNILKEKENLNKIPQKIETMKPVAGAHTRKIEMDKKVHAKDILQPVNLKTGYMDENFNKIYGEDKNPFVGTDRDPRTNGKGDKTC